MDVEFSVPNFEDALCKEIGHEFFFTESKYVADERRMLKEMCGACPAQQACFEWGLHHEEYGAWGGYTVNELREIRKKRGIPLRLITLEMVLGKMVSYS